MSSSGFRETISQKNASVSQRFLQNLFIHWFDALVYNQVWEDPRVDLEALELNANSRILTISSGGCNALNYLLACPSSILAIDINPNHISLLRLKIATICNAPEFTDFFKLFGIGKHENIRKLYSEYLAPNLDSQTKQFWESRTLLQRFAVNDRLDFFSKRGLYNYSRSGYFLRSFQALAHRLGYQPEILLNANSIQDQQLIAEAQIGKFFDSKLIRTIGLLPIILFGLGVPPQQMKKLSKEHRDEKTLTEVYRNRALRFACKTPIAENYFAWQGFSRQYDLENQIALPEYLKEENFDLLRSCIPRLESEVSTLSKTIRTSEFDRFNRFVFLDSQDWMDDQALVEFWKLLAMKTKSGARIIFRSATRKPPFANLLPKSIQREFIYEKARSRELYEKDRVSVYGGFHLYIRK